MSSPPMQATAMDLQVSQGVATCPVLQLTFAKPLSDS